MDDIKASLRAEVLSEALPYIQEFHNEKIVVKFGGSTMQDKETKKRIAKDIVLLQYVGFKPLVIHGGGPEIADTLERLDMDSNFADGLRVTDEETMDVVEMVLAGRVNKDIVNEINEAGSKAIGLSGKDGRMLRAVPHSSGEELDVDLGQVGEIQSVDPDPIALLESEDFVPVVAPIGVDENGVTYNMNADQVAGAMAAALEARKLIFLTNVDGILSEGQPLSTVKVDELDPMIEDGQIEGGMVPKVKAASHAVRNGVNKAHIINGQQNHSLLLELLTEEGIGTQILHSDGVSGDENNV